MTRTVAGFRVGALTPENVLRANGLDTRATVEQLVIASAPHDATNPGYLSQAELQKGAADLLAHGGGTLPTPADTFSLSRKVLSDVKVEVLSGLGRTFTDDEVVASAGQWDDGNRYLKKAEVRAGALELQILARTGQLTAADLAAIAQTTGTQRKDTAPATDVELGVVSDIDKTAMKPTATGATTAPPYPGIAALYRAIDAGNNGTGLPGDVTYVTARTPQRSVDLPAWLAANAFPAGAVQTGVSSIPAVAENEKVADITRLFQAHPQQQFVLFGDTNHRDPDVYTRIRALFPAQVKAVIMHDVKAIDPARTVNQDVVHNYAQAAAVLFGHGVLDEANARAVMVNAQAGGLEITDAQIQTLLNDHRR